MKENKPVSADEVREKQLAELAKKDLDKIAEIENRTTRGAKEAARPFGNALGVLFFVEQIANIPSVWQFLGVSRRQIYLLRVSLPSDPSEIVNSSHSVWLDIKEPFRSSETCLMFHTGQGGFFSANEVYSYLKDAEKDEKIKYPGSTVPSQITLQQLAGLSKMDIVRSFESGIESSIKA